eukprot:6478335-Alexandrium_andersonii.AAC.1
MHAECVSNLVLEHVRVRCACYSCATRALCVHYACMRVRRRLWREPNAHRMRQLCVVYTPLVPMCAPFLRAWVQRICAHLRAGYACMGAPVMQRRDCL